MRTMTLLLSLCFLSLSGCDEITIEFGEPAAKRPQCPDGKCPLRKPKVNLQIYRRWKVGGYGELWMDLPKELREKNYAGGSCVHASTEMVLRWQGFEELADWWRQQYSGGEYAGGLIGKFNKANLQFAYTTDGEESFLEWVSRTRRGAVIFYKPMHSICFCGYDTSGNAILLDNNHIDRYEKVPKETFLRNWKNRYRGFALTPVYSPAPPTPYVASALGGIR